VPTDRDHATESELTRASAALDHTRDQFALSMGALEHEITRTLDWREWVRRKPGTALALAFGVGLFLGNRR
jgi:ElaB/YqjD/DUF883 family membrane-anchored ribosome-binding protein